VRFDADKIQKVLSNLLSNAFKFTPNSGTVQINAYYLEENIFFEIADTGIGITKDDQQHLFTPYFQSNQKKWKHQPGTGLGLALVKQLVELHQGSITIESNPGVGTTVLVKLPIVQNGNAAEQAMDIEATILTSVDEEVDGITLSTSKIPGGNGDSVLVVEDNEELRTFLEQILKQNGFTVSTASDGRDGFAKAFDLIPDLIVSDLVMPALDGIELTKACKRDERTNHIPVVLLTANSEQSKKLIGLKTGADDYLTKPFSTEELLVRINNLIQQRKTLAKKFREQIFATPTPIHELSLDERFIQNAKAVVELNISNYQFSVEHLADHMNLSRTQLLRKLKALTGFSPSDFIRSIRLQRAAQMIRQRVDTVTQIAYAVGFNDQSYFAKSFKKEFGVSPTEYASQATVAD